MLLLLLLRRRPEQPHSLAGHASCLWHGQAITMCLLLRKGNLVPHHAALAVFV
jgi:hypothetical protein